MPRLTARFDARECPTPDRTRVTGVSCRIAGVSGSAPSEADARVVRHGLEDAMSIKRLVCLVAAIVSLGAGSAHAQSNWPGTGTEQMAADQTVPYLPAVPPLICPGGEQACLAALATELSARTEALGCDHAAVFSDAYLAITQALQDATGTPGFFDRPDRVNHEAKTYAQEYFDQFDRWHAGAPFAVASPAWEVAFRAARLQSVTALGDLMLALNAHIRRDNPIRAVEQTEGVLRVPGTMPAASGKPDHERVNVVLVNAMTTMLTRLARRYDPTLDDGADLDPRALYSIIAAWREESWRNAEQLRHARATGGVNGMLYQAKLAQIELTAKLGADAILAATLTDPLRNAQRNAYCEAHS
jgi:Family of unknown function (DUF5995)